MLDPLPEPRLDVGSAGCARAGTSRDCRDAELANWRAWSAFTRRLSARPTAAGLGCALAMSSASRPRMPTVDVAVVVEPLLPPNSPPSVALR